MTEEIDVAWASSPGTSEHPDIMEIDLEPPFPYPIYLLAKEGENIRRDFALRHIEKTFGKEPVLIAGIDGMKHEEWRYARMTDNARKELNGGNKACITGHIEIWIRFIKEGSKSALVVEDDAAFECGARQWIEEFLKWRERDQCDVSGCAYFPPIHHYHWAILFSNLAYMPWVKDIDSGEEMHRHPFYLARECSWMTGAYLISREGAIWLLNKTCPVDNLTDAYTRYGAGEKDVLAWQCHPAIAHQNGTPSFIGTTSKLNPAV